MNQPWGSTNREPETELYDRIGRGYTNTRRPDPRLARAIWDALGDAATVLNVGAGSGAYEPTDRRRGLSELLRVARHRVVLFNADPADADRFWLTTEYLPEFLELIPPRYRRAGAWEEELRAALGNVALTPVPVPHDCTDGFYGAFWRRPEAYRDPGVRAGISVFAQLSSRAVDRAVDALGADLETGRWHEKHRALLRLSELHLGYYVIAAEPTSQTGGRT